MYKTTLRFLANAALLVGMLLVVPPAVFWSVRTIIPVWAVPTSIQTISAFWILYVLTHVGTYTIRYSEWSLDWFFSITDDL